MRILLLAICIFFPPLTVSAQESYDSLQELFVDTTAFYTDTTLYGDTDYSEESYSDEYAYDEDNTDSNTEHSLIPPDDLETTAEYKAKEVKVNEFEKEKWKSIVAETDYNEEKEKEDEEEKKSESINRPNINLPWNAPGLQLVAYGIIIAVVVTVLYLILRNFSLSKKINKSQLRTEDFNAVEDIEELEVDDLLQQAVGEGNFKLAIRLYFLRLLKSLHGKGYIYWKKDKTNNDYLLELFVKNFNYREIKKLTLAYEQVWYGEHGVTAEGFRALKNDFDMIQQNLQASVNQ